MRWFETLPKAADTFFLVFYDLLALWAVLLLAATVLFVRRFRLARDLLVAGALAWLLGRLLAFVWGRTSLGNAFEIVLDATRRASLPDGPQSAIAVAMVIVASPHLTRPVRRVGQVLVILLALSAMYLGRAYPTDLLGAIVLGWGVAAAVHLAFGTPDRRPTRRPGRLGTCGASASRSPTCASRRPAGGPGDLRGQRRSGRRSVRVTALGRDEADAQLHRSGVALRRVPRHRRRRSSRPAVSRSSTRPTWSCSRATAASHVPRVDRGRRHPRASPSSPRRSPKGPPRRTRAPNGVTDALLRGVWQRGRQAARRRASRTARSTPSTSSSAISDRPVLVGFEAAIDEARRAGRWRRDVAQLLGTTAALVDRRERSRRASPWQSATTRSAMRSRSSRPPS